MDPSAQRTRIIYSDFEIKTHEAIDKLVRLNTEEYRNYEIEHFNHKLAMKLRERMSELHPGIGGWSSIVGTSFAGAFAFQKNSMLHLTVDGMHIVLFRTPITRNIKSRELG
ncbi:unnamed protein product [Caenorhabditis auriculariae]|uniref:Dynein light chain n=1 Tax=Caenorhabditis auriculariae TaxID=2777116 RepID=A0A8S1H984_9PELO|nr:unnamed protein product [Caenorhabditis auriculariae]